MDLTTASPSFGPSNLHEDLSRNGVRFNTVKQEEVAAIKSRWCKFGIQGDGHLGLALSGGGVRSATFSLGILQFLARTGLLRHVDYLSTVSGGGYIGSWLYSWIQRKQVESGADGAKQAFDTVCQQLGGENGMRRPESNWEPEGITFLRQYSSSVMPRRSAFSVDTWLTFFTYLRNLALHMLILIAAYGTLVLVVRLAGWYAVRLLDFKNSLAAPLSTWIGETYGIVVELIATAWLVPMLRMTGRNLAVLSTPPLRTSGANRREGESANAEVIRKCAWALPAALFWSVSLFATSGLKEGALWQHVASNWVILSVTFSYLHNKSSASKHVTTRMKRARTPKAVAQRCVSTITRLIKPCVAAFVTAYLLAIGAFSTLPMSDVHKWVMFTFGPPYVLCSLIVGLIILVGLMGQDIPEASAQWMERLCIWLLIYAVSWIVIVGESVYGPWLAVKAVVHRDLFQAATDAAKRDQSAVDLWKALLGTVGAPSAVWIGTRKHVLRALHSRLTSFVSATAALACIAEIMIIVSLAIHWCLAYGTIIPPERNPPAAHGEIYDLTIRNGAVQLQRQRAGEMSDTGPHWILNRYWPSLRATELWVTATGRPAYCGLLVLLSICLLTTFVFCSRIDVNRYSMRNFYKNRLVRCFLGASNEARIANHFTAFDKSDDIAFHLYAPEMGYYGPYPIVNATLQVSSGGKLRTHDRQRQSFVFTPKYTGFSAETLVDEMRLGDESGRALNRYEANPDRERSDEVLPRAHGYRPTRYVGGGISTGMAVAISGAPGDPTSGHHTSNAVSFLFALSDRRRGWWLGNPLKTTFARSGPGSGILYLILQLFGLDNADRSYVNLTDGGHFDNMGIYELIRRRCRYVICCDSEEDPEMSLLGIANAIRKCRMDFGVEIDLSFERLFEVDGFSRTHCVVGRIHYNASDGEREDGYLVYLKAALTSEDPGELLAYRARTPEFPHQTASTEPFDEAHFESYRELGLHTAKVAFGSSDTTKLDAGQRDDFFRELYETWHADGAARTVKVAARASFE